MKMECSSESEKVQCSSESEREFEKDGQVWRRGGGRGAGGTLRFII